MGFTHAKWVYDFCLIVIDSATYVDTMLRMCTMYLWQEVVPATTMLSLHPTHNNSDWASKWGYIEHL